MCGLAGLFGAGARLKDIEPMTQSLAHRGPNDEGFFVDALSSLALGHRRLSILDLSSQGHQPMMSEDGQVSLVYNGEIYNYLELKKELVKAGYVFHSGSDTEVLLKAYLHWGPTMCEKFRGMFAYALWDKKTQCLHLGRDRLGIKPLYILRMNGGWAFASELRAFFKVSHYKPELEKKALASYLDFYAIAPPLTLLKGVRVLEPGMRLELYKDGKEQEFVYWKLEDSEKKGQKNISSEEACLEIRRRLEEAVSIRMRADVPVGAFLSGGLDSSIIVGLMSRHTSYPIQSFSIGYESEGANLNEWSDARKTAKLYGTEHREICINAQNFKECYEHFLTAIDQPSGDGFNAYMVSRFTAQSVKVAMSGLGGDELFGGYPQYQKLYLLSRLKKWPAQKGLDFLARIHARLPDSLKFRGSLSLFYYWFRSPEDCFRSLRRPFSEKEKLGLWNPELCESENEKAFWNKGKEDEDFFRRLLQFETRGYMNHTLLKDSDAVSMAHSLELRVPLIDHELVEFVWALPSHLKMKKRTYNKPLLVEACLDVLHKDIINLPKKGFEMPLAHWMKKELQDELKELTLSPLFNPPAIQAVVEGFLKGHGSYMRVWSLLVLARWCKDNKLV